MSSFLEEQILISFIIMQQPFSGALTRKSKNIIITHMYAFDITWKHMNYTCFLQISASGGKGCLCSPRRNQAMLPLYFFYSDYDSEFIQSRLQITLSRVRNDIRDV